MYSTELRVVILSERPLPDNFTLADLDFETREGEWVLANYVNWPDVVSSKELTPEQMRTALLRSHSDPHFFELGESG